MSLLEILLLGESGVGKTSIMEKYVNDNFTEQYKSTIGADFVSKPIVIENKLSCCAAEGTLLLANSLQIRRGSLWNPALERWQR